MLEAIDKMVLAGLGALSMTRQKAGKVFDNLVSKGQAVRGNREGFIKETLAAAKKASKDVEDTVAKHVRQAMAKMDIASRRDVERLEKKLNQALRRKSKQA